MSRNRIASIALFAALALAGCIGPGCSERAQTQAVSTIADRFPMEIGGVPITVQVALTQPEQRKGLMYRTELADGEGMIFVNRSADRQSYWMNHVPIPLSIGFIEPDGTLNEVRRMLPNDTRSTISSSTDIQFVLEMNDGWFERHGVKAGAKLDMKKLAAALEARGEEARSFGLK